MTGIALVITIVGLFNQEIPIPNAVSYVSSLARDGEIFYLGSGRDRSILKMDSKGRLIQSYENRGSGPGSLGRFTTIKIFNGQLFIPDILQRKITILNTDFTFNRDLKVKGLCRDIYDDGNHYYIIYCDLSNFSMVHKFDKKMNHLLSFGAGIKNKGLIGFQNGRIVIHKEKVYFIHSFIPAIEIYSLEGELLKHKTLPGFDKPFLESESDVNHFPDRLALEDLFPFKKYFIIKLKNREERKAWIYAYDSLSNQFLERKPCPWDTVSDHSGRFYEVISDEFNEPVALKFITLDLPN